ncbi:hypothetical protein GDO81_017728 [Engystomops pustulosus]|uniref:PDZ domain-containing protein n=2 Tax=Engystomops pustulosus TaxID=76066 RepID=A0AAV7A7N3_ENGPU|nr:hypothetical protein GDO81_017728 [Engystomops pustulosus]KAG8555501.1 hypothetical protein GDO81_017728 [Engystomops pustulosus]
MEMEVNTRECVSPTDKRRSTGRASKSPRKVRPANGKSRDTERTDRSGKPEDPGGRTSVLQGKVQALKEKQKVKESRHSGSHGSGGDTSEDALVSPQLRTYLTEDLLDCNKQELCPGAQQEIWGSDDPWATCNIDGSSLSHCNSCQIENLSKCSHIIENSSHDSHSSCDNPSSTPCSTGDPQSSLSLAERVERNRLELRCKLNRTAAHHVDNTNGQGHVNWLLPSDIDADSGVSIPVTEDCGELSVRHEQAKQLLHRARMKAKGASPLRASHCVLPHPHSQPSLRRGPIAGGVTDGGSQSDSSSSDYCSWHKGSRGSSPSHVRFQDESERDVEERYRERQHVPQTTSTSNTPAPKRQANGPPSWTEQLSPSGHGQCGSCGSNIKGSGAGPAASHGTNLRNVHLGSKITQDGSNNSPLGVKPSPHWILPSQPWRVHTELIRETHIGGDSTADSSGEEDGSRTHSNKTHRWGTHKIHKYSSPNTSEHGAILRPMRSFSDADTRIGGTNSEQVIKGKNGTSVFALETRFKEKPEPSSILKLSEPHPQVGTITGGYYIDSVKTGVTKMQQEIEIKPTRKPKSLTLDREKGFNTLHTELETGNIVLNLDTRQGAADQMDSRTRMAPMGQSMPVVSQSDSGKTQGSLSNRVPVPPPGKAPTVVLSRNSRHTVRIENINQQPLQGGNKVPVFMDKKGIQSNPVPNAKVTNPDILGDIDNHHLSICTMKSVEAKVREASTKRPSNEGKIKEAKENRMTSGKKQVKREPRDNESSHSGGRHLHCERNNSTKDLGESGSSPKVNSQPKEEMMNEGNFLRKEKCNEKPKTNGHQTANNEHTGSGPIIATKDRCIEMTPESKVQSEVKKGDIRSGMRKIFSSIGLTSRPKLERFQSSSLEQISSPDLHKGHTSANGDSELYVGSGKLGMIKKSPSLQSLKLMSPFNLPRRASSVQNLLGKSDRSAAYITGEVNTAPRRALSVEDIGSPGMARALGKVAEVYPDGTRLLQLHCMENGGFGFRVSSGNGRPDSGIYVQDISDANTAKLYSGLLRVGDEILEVNGAKVSTLGLGQVNSLLHREPTLSLRVLHQRRTKC